MGGPPPPPLPAVEGQTYCLRWNNHKSNLVEILDALIKVESYVDCTIVVDDQVQFKAHRVVLAANSPYFQTILQDVPMDHCSIIFPGVKAFEMRALLEYMYTGEVNVTQSQIPKIMRIAEELEVKGLFDMADLKEKFNKLSEEHTDRAAGNPYASAAATTIPPYTSAAATSSSAASSSAAAAGCQNGGKDHTAESAHSHPHSSSVISTSSNISPSAAPSSSSSPPYSTYKSPYSNLYTKSPGPSALQSSSSAAAAAAVAAAAAATATAQTPTHSQTQQQTNSEHGQWPLSPSAAAAAAMLSSVYESASDMNPLKRKKLSSISSMLMNRDTPILRNVLAQANPADSSQPALPLMLPTAGKNEKPANDKNSPHPTMVAGHNNNHSFNGSDYSSQDKKYHDEPHSPYTDRSFEDETFDPKGNFSGNFGANANQKPEWKRYKQYTRNDIMSAIQCVRDGMSALQASRKFGVPSRTLYDKVKKLGITTGRPMNRTMKRSPSNVESSAAFPYAHGYGQTEPLLSSMHERERERERDEREREREPKEHHRVEHHHMPPTIPHPAAALLDHAFLQQALENRGGDIAGREALHAMALAAAAHAAANRMSTSPGPNGTAARSPSPSYAMKYGRQSDHELLLEREKERRILESEMERDLEMERERERERGRERERERDNERDMDDDEDDQVEDLSVARKDCHSPPAMARRRSDSPYSPPSPTPPPPAPPAPPASALAVLPTSSSAAAAAAVLAENNGGVIRNNKMAAANSSSTSSTSTASSDELLGEVTVKREIITDDVRAD